MRVFLDACVIIYWVEAAEPFYSKFIATLRDIAISHPEHVLTISRLSFLECLVKPRREKEITILKTYQRFFESPGLSIIEIDHHVIDLAVTLRADYSIRTPDAIQMASCLSTGEAHLFLTNDMKLAKIPSLNVRLI